MEGTQKCSLCGSALPYTPAPTPVTPPPSPTETVTPPPAPVNNTAPTPPAAPTPTPPTQSGGKNQRFTLFQTSNWEDDWISAVASAEDDDKKAGIILTNTKGCSGSLRNELWMNLTEYMNFKSQKDGVEYYVLDLATQAVQSTYTGEIESVLDILEAVYSLDLPTYLMIIGDYATVPNIVWENRSKDPDKVVFSDLPFSTLSTDSPFNDILYKFKPFTRVGRIPSSAGTGFKEAFTYLKNTKNSKLTVDDLKAFFLSAESWIETSKQIAKPIAPSLNVSPSNGSFEFKGSVDPYNVLMFNLHGSNGTHVWYGEDRNENVEFAFNAPKLPKNKNYILCTEACYGARPLNKGMNSESMVSTALRTGCCAFVGSTQIAWGGRNGMSCADIVNQNFIKNMMEGYSAGESFNDALAHLQNGRWNDCSLKTIIEFALYGDPSYTPLNSANKAKSMVRQKAFSMENLSYRVVEGEEQKAVSVKAAFVEDTDHCAVKVRAFVEEAHPDMKGVKPRFFMDECTGDYQAIYNKESRNTAVSKSVKVFFDSNGSIKEQYVSKYVKV